MISYEGNWNDEERLIATNVIHKTIIKLDKLIEKDAFKKIFNYDIILEATNNVPGEYYGFVDKLYPNRIKVQIGNITEPLLLHEIAHTLQLSFPRHEGPADWLGSNVIRTTSGKAVTGMGSGRYFRNMGYYLPRYTGYISVDYPEHQHPMSWDNGNNSTEDFCDMFSSLILDNIADNDSGLALKTWIIWFLRKRLIA